eukprot:scaffold877_cov314-Pavlova_lutheri.AAC.6
MCWTGRPVRLRPHCACAEEQGGARRLRQVRPTAAGGRGDRRPEQAAAGQGIQEGRGRDHGGPRRHGRRGSLGNGGEPTERGEGHPEDLLVRSGVRVDAFDGQREAGDEDAAREEHCAERHRAIVWDRSHPLLHVRARILHARGRRAKGRPSFLAGRGSHQVYHLSPHAGPQVRRFLGTCMPRPHGCRSVQQGGHHWRLHWKEVRAYGRIGRPLCGHRGLPDPGRQHGHAEGEGYLRSGPHAVLRRGRRGARAGGHQASLEGRAGQDRTSLPGRYLLCRFSSRELARNRQGRRVGRQNHLKWATQAQYHVNRSPSSSSFATGMPFATVCLARVLGPSSSLAGLLARIQAE